MFLPAKVGDRIVWGSAKSFSQPTFGQTATSADGVLQNFVYIVCCCTRRIWTLKPRASRFCLTTSAVLAATPWLEPTIRISSVPSYLPEA